METCVGEFDRGVPVGGVGWVFLLEEFGEGEHVHEVGGLEDGVGEGGLNEVFFDGALAVVV